MAEHAVVDGQTHLRIVDLTGTCLTAELPGELAYLRDCLRRDGFAERAQPTGGVHGDPATDGSVAVA